MKNKFAAYFKPLQPNQECLTFSVRHATQSSLTSRESWIPRPCHIINWMICVVSLHVWSRAGTSSEHESCWGHVEHQMPSRDTFADSEKAEFVSSTPPQPFTNGDGKSCMLQGLSWEIKILHGCHLPSWETARHLSCTHSSYNLQAIQLLLRELQRCSYTGEGSWGYQVIFNWPNHLNTKCRQLTLPLSIAKFWKK